LWWHFVEQLEELVATNRRAILNFSKLFTNLADARRINSLVPGSNGRIRNRTITIRNVVTLDSLLCVGRFDLFLNAGWLPMRFYLTFGSGWSFQ
jgi:hypothetical protein